MKKGFTLVELLVVLVIIGMLSLVVYPSIMGVIKSSREDAYNSQIKVIEKVTKEWAVSNPEMLPEIDDVNGECTCNPSSKCISIDELKGSGYLSDDDVKNPKGGDLTGGVEITCKCDSCSTCKYEYKYIETCDSLEN
ncbi:MAG: prepilin-type N-terminal cleavage/methylation domain-containing protein [Bacilli bacterium]|nr:prepilin-type N-terminal cleavage/methylation domain-containing protein [Bacilli bacterium]